MPSTYQTWRPKQNRGSRTSGTLMDYYFRGNDYSATPERESYTRSWTSPAEHLDNLRDSVNKQPVQYRYENGKLIAYKTQPKGQIPEEMRPWASKYRHLYGEGDLTSEWVLPGDALTAPKLLQRQVPMGDFGRSMSFRSGIGMQGQNTAGVNPVSFWPGSSFNVPSFRSGNSRSGGSMMPGFGRVDYTTGRFNMPTYSGVPTYGRFDNKRKTFNGYWR